MRVKHIYLSLLASLLKSVKLTPTDRHICIRDGLEGVDERQHVWRYDLC